jgi:hypothetical protein
MTNPALDEVIAVDPRHAWTIGGGSLGPFIEKWNGTSWQQVPNLTPR